MKPNPLFAFRSQWDLTQPEAGEFFDLSRETLSGYERGRFPMPEWLAEWLEDPMMTDAEILRRVKEARYRAAVKANSTKRNPRGNGNLFRAWRKNQGMTQKQAARMLGVATTSISAWEQGDRMIPEEIMRRIDDEPYG